MGACGLAYYINRVEHYGGALVLFPRNLDIAVPNSKTHRRPNWYMRLKIAGRNGYVERSAKLTKYEDAYTFAQSEFLRLQQAVRLGHRLTDYTFEQHWNDWYSRNLKNNTLQHERQRWHKLYFERYFNAFFTTPAGASMPLNEITSQVAAEYWDWRKTTGQAIPLLSS